MRLKIFLSILFLCCISALTAQTVADTEVTEIWTNYDGFWNAATGSTPVPNVQPDNSHELLAYRFVEYDASGNEISNTVYSTGVNDAKLTAEGVSFSAKTMRALPIPGLDVSSPANNYFVGLGQLYDGVDNGADNGNINPFQPITTPSELAFFLTDGVQGLDLGTNVANIPTDDIEFNLSTNGITLAFIDDGVPDLLVSQTADPSSSTFDELEFVDAGGATVGSVVQLQINAEPELAIWNPDFYNLDSTIGNGGNFLNTTRPIRFFAVELKDFNLNTTTTTDQDYYKNAVKLIYRPNGTSDPSFIAFNEPSLGVATQLAVNNVPANQNCDGTIPLTGSPLAGIAVTLEDQGGDGVAQAGITVTAELASGPGELLGTLEVDTDGAGQAVFDNLSFSIGGAHIIRFTSPGLDDVITTVIADATGCITIQWTGTTDTQWDVATNWSPQQVPDANNPVNILNEYDDGSGPSAITNWPVLDADAGAGDLTMESNARITLDGNLLALNGDLTITSGAKIDASASGSNLYMSGSSAQTIPDDLLGSGVGLTDKEVASMTIENSSAGGVTLEDSVDLTETLNLLDGTLSIDNSTSTFTFKSTLGKTAVLSEVATGADINGCVVVERFVPATNRAFRFIGSPLNGTTTCGSETIFESLQEGGQITSLGATDDPVLGFGTHITGLKDADYTHGTDPNPGFDVTQTGNPGMYTWEEGTQDWNEIANTNNTTLSVADAYALFIRGDRSLDLSVNNSQVGGETTLRFNGELETGNVDVSAGLATADTEVSLVANPYQAQVNMKDLLQSKTCGCIDNTKMYVFDPTIGTHGAYITVDFNAAPGSVAVPTPDGSSPDDFIYLQPNQAAFIITDGTSPTLNFEEVYKRKTNQTSTIGVFSESQSLVNALDVYLEREVQGNFTMVDGVKFYYSNKFENTITKRDAIKFWNQDESLGIVSNDTYLSIERRDLPEENTSTNLFIDNYTGTNYKLKLNLENISFEVELKDNYLDQTLELVNNNVNTYTFAVDENIPESIATDRFSLVYPQETLNTSEVDKQHMIVFPNPADDRLSIQTPENISHKVRLLFYDITGRLIRTKELSPKGRTVQTDVSDLSNGIYTLKVEADNRVYNQKLIIK